MFPGEYCYLSIYEECISICIRIIGQESFITIAAQGSRNTCEGMLSLQCASVMFRSCSSAILCAALKPQLHLPRLHTCKLFTRQCTVFRVLEASMHRRHRLCALGGGQVGLLCLYLWREISDFRRAHLHAGKGYWIPFQCCRHLFKMLGIRRNRLERALKAARI